LTYPNLLIYNDLEFRDRLLIYKINRGSNLRVGKGVFLSRNSIECGKNVTIEDYSVLSGNIRIDDNVYIHRNVLLRSFNGFIHIGESTTINPFTTIYGHGNVKIGRFVSIATKSSIVSSNHNFELTDIYIKEQGLTSKEIIIEDDVWIGSNVVILSGVKIGKGSIVGAGSVVNKDVGEYTIVGGIPAKLLRLRSKK